MPAGGKVVIDTNIVLDLFVFNDEDAQPLRELLDAKSVDWISTPHMRDELERVLAYPQIIPRLVFHELSSEDVLARFDRHARIVPAAPKALITCTDADDQCFIDLAVQHRAMLVSKDRAVLKMKKRLLAHGAKAAASWKPLTA